MKDPPSRPQLHRKSARISVGNFRFLTVPVFWATIRSAPPQWTQVLTSMLTKSPGAIWNSRKAGPKGGGQDARSKTRLRRCAQVIACRRSMGLRSSMLAPADATSVAGRLPRPDGVSCARNFAFGAKTPWRNGTTHVEFEPVDFIAVSGCHKPRKNGEFPARRPVTSTAATQTGPDRPRLLESTGSVRGQSRSSSTNGLACSSAAGGGCRSSR